MIFYLFYFYFFHVSFEIVGQSNGLGHILGVDNLKD